MFASIRDISSSVSQRVVALHRMVTEDEPRLMIPCRAQIERVHMYAHHFPPTSSAASGNDCRPLAQRLHSEGKGKRRETAFLFGLNMRT